MKTIGILMAMLMVFGTFAGAGIALAQDDEIKVNALRTSNIQGKPVFVASSLGVASSVEAVRVFPENSGVLDSATFNRVIDEVDDAVGENGRKVGFLKGTYGKGHFIDGDHLGFLQLLWVRALVTESSDASETIKRIAGRLKVDGKVYKLSHGTLEDDTVEFDLTASNGDDKGKLTLELVNSYDDGERKVWIGKIELGDIEGKVDLITVTRSVRKASDREIKEVAPPRIAGEISELDTSDQEEKKSASESEGKGFAWRRIIDYFT